MFSVYSQYSYTVFSVLSLPTVYFCVETQTYILIYAILFKDWC